MWQQSQARSSRVRLLFSFLTVYILDSFPYLIHLSPFHSHVGCERLGAGGSSRGSGVRGQVESTAAFILYRKSNSYLVRYVPDMSNVH